MAKKISSSVGKGGKNKPEDVVIIQELLNVNANKIGLHRPLRVDGIAGKNTIAAIEAFQKRVGIHPLDGQVDANGRVLVALSR